MSEIIEQYIERYKPSNQAEREQALREILQELTLIGLWRAKFFEHAAFYGGTALRILHGLDRFSEDLDFTLTTPDLEFNWERYAHTIIDELNSYGFNVEIQEKLKKSSSAIRSAFLKTNTFQSLLLIGADQSLLQGVNQRAMIRVKVEIDTDPIPGLRYEQVYTKQPFPRPIKAVVKSDLFASKMHAALFRAWKKRIKGRDWWDIVWFIRQNIPINLNHLEICLKTRGQLEQNKTLTKEILIDIFTKRVMEIDIDMAKNDIQPFIKDASILEDWSEEYFIYWINQIRIE